MNSKRIAKIKGARSLNDILDVVSEITYEFKNSSAIVSKLVSSLSSELVMDMRDTKPRTIKMTVKEENYVPPKLEDLKKPVDVVNRLHDNALELDAAEAMIKQSFAGNKKLPNALSAIKALKDEIDDSINDAFEALEAIAEKHVPKKFERLADSITSHVIDVLPVKTYGSITRQLLVVPDVKEKSMFHFCSYIGVTKLKNLQGFTYEEYFFVVTGVVDNTGNMHYLINGLPDFKIPGSYPLGKEINDLGAARKHIDMLLDHNNFVIDHGRLPMPVSPERAKTAGFTEIRGVVSVDVKDDEFIATLEPTVTDRLRDRIVIELLARLNSIVGAKKNDKLFQYKPVMRSGKKAIQIILVPNIGRKANLSIQQLDEFAELMNMTDKQKTAMRFAMQN